MSKSSIEWCDHTINPIRARDVAAGGRGHYCEKISAGCTHCYASRLQPRFGMPAFETQRRVGVESYFDDTKLMQVVKRKAPTRYFWCDMTDMFGSWVPDAWLDCCFATMAQTPQHTHLVLTKRAARMREYSTTLQTLDSKARARRIVGSMYADQPARRLVLENIDDAHLGGFDWPLANVWMGVSVENQPAATRLEQLLATPAVLRYVSAEPLLEAIEISPWLVPGQTRLDWGIFGGESFGRPCDIAWVRSLLQQFQAAGVPAFVKQLGTIPMMDEALWRQLPRAPLLNAGHGLRVPAGFVPLKLQSRKGGDMAEWPEDLRVREFPEVAA
jgi:protein gp37